MTVKDSHGGCIRHVTSLRLAEESCAKTLGSPESRVPKDLSRRSTNGPCSRESLDKTAGRAQNFRWGSCWGMARSGTPAATLVKKSDAKRGQDGIRGSRRSMRRFWRRILHAGGISLSYLKPATVATLRLLLVAISLRTSGATVENGFELRVKTCDEIGARTKDALNISFCAGGSACTSGPANPYNVHHEVYVNGGSAVFTFPLDYEPTTMQISKGLHDAWCVDALTWDNGPNLLGEGGRIYLDGDLGHAGCQFGIHDFLGLRFPCHYTWRFFNLPGSDDYRYEIGVKPCKGVPSSEVMVSFCAEPTCNTTAAVVTERYLTIDATTKWTKAEVKLDYNPVSMRVSPLGAEWCAEELIFNGYSLVTDATRPVRLQPGESKRFFNVQYNGMYVDPPPTRSSDQQRGTPFDTLIVTVIMTLVASIAIGASWYASTRIRRFLFPQKPDEGLKEGEGVSPLELEGQRPRRGR